MYAKASIGVIVLLMAACQYDPFAHEFTKARPAEHSLVGTYVPDEETSERLRKSLNVQLQPATALTLNQDHTFEARNLPNCWIGPSLDCVAGTESWSGTWSLKQSQEWWAIGLHLRSRNGEKTDFGMVAMLRGEHPPYLVHLTIGDPDSGDALAFQRSAAP
jgi:hypothetical protein